MTSPVSQDVALLAPVPVEHILSGLPIVGAHGFVAFGSMNWELFRSLDNLRQERSVPTFLYPSAEGALSGENFEAKWVGRYIGHVESVRGAHPAGMKHRPPSTANYAADNKGHWAVFWHLADLRELPPESVRPISEFIAYGSGQLRKNAAPRGPALVTIPAWHRG